MSLRLASPFQDHAVFQRDQMIPVWGWTTPESRVRVLLAGREAHGLSNSTGEFIVRLPALPTGGVHFLRAELIETNEFVEVRDILIGEVWLASGQSNMEWRLDQCLPESAEDISNADFPDIRIFTAEHRAHLGPQTTVTGEWRSATSNNASAFSAIAYGFARELHQKLRVPIGILSSSWGGTMIQPWTSRQTLAANPDYAALLADLDQRVWDAASWNKHDESKAPPELPADPGITQAWHLPELNDSDWQKFEAPRTWQAAGHPTPGVFWFRRQVLIPEAWKGRDLELGVGSVDKQDITFVNGVEVGRTGKGFENRFWNIPRSYTVPAKLVASPQLTVAIRAYSFAFDGGLIGPSTCMWIRPAGDKTSSISLTGEWRLRREHDFGPVTPIRVIIPGHGEPNTPHILFDNMIRPLIPYALRGAIWYQGESNAFEHGRYAHLMSDLIQDWRHHWGRPDLAFHLVQLPGYKYPSDHQQDSTWAPMRVAQADAAANSRAGIANTLEFGDVTNIHPRNKAPVAARLARSALALTYGQPLLPCGPSPRAYAREGSAIRIHFNDAGTGLSTTDGRPPQSFYLAGADGVFHPAEACIEGAAVIVRSNAVSTPDAVRYAWADNPISANLSNSDGLTAGTFCSRHWWDFAPRPTTPN